MNQATMYAPQRIDNLGIVAGICQEISPVARIDTQFGESQRKVSCGQAVIALLLNALGFSRRARDLLPEHLSNKPVAVLIDGELTAASLSYDALLQEDEQAAFVMDSDSYCNATYPPFKTFCLKRVMMHNRRTTPEWPRVVWGLCVCYLSESDEERTRRVACGFLYLSADRLFVLLFPFCLNEKGIYAQQTASKCCARKLADPVGRHRPGVCRSGRSGWGGAACR